MTTCFRQLRYNTFSINLVYLARVVEEILVPKIGTTTDSASRISSNIGDFVIATICALCGIAPECCSP